MENSWTATADQSPPTNQPFWAYLYDSGIRLMQWRSAEELAAEDGADPATYEGGWFEVHNDNENWEPTYWLPKDAIPATPPRPSWAS